MRTISCPECKEMVDKESDFCPFCGLRQPGKSSPGKKVFFTFFLGTIVILFLVFLIPDKPSDQATSLALNKTGAAARWQAVDHSTSAYTMASIYLRDRLKLPGSAKFPTLSEGQQDHVRNLGMQRYHVVSYVDTEDEFGRMVRIQFQGEIEQTKEDEWHLISLDTQRGTEEIVFSLKSPSK